VSDHSSVKAHAMATNDREDRNPLTVLLYGAGAVGLSFASCLIRSGEKVDIVARGDTYRCIGEHGISRIGVLGDYWAAPQSFRLISGLHLADGPYDVVLIATKTTALDAVCRDLIERRLSIEAMVFLQNGWGNTERFEEHFARESLFSAAVYCGFARPEKHIVRVTSFGGPTHVGSLYSPCGQGIAALCQSLANGGIPCVVDGEIGAALWSKMLYNCTLNPLTALLREFRARVLRHEGDDC
jgi:2-dehydropantoate 2-reductase